MRKQRINVLRKLNHGPLDLTRKISLEAQIQWLKGISPVKIKEFMSKLKLRTVKVVEDVQAVETIIMSKEKEWMSKLLNGATRETDSNVARGQDLEDCEEEESEDIETSEELNLTIVVEGGASLQDCIKVKCHVLVFCGPFVSCVSNDPMHCDLKLKHVSVKGGKRSGDNGVKHLNAYQVIDELPYPQSATVSPVH
ncbi:hypothetical protein U1Q18_014290 [Sarracenia purpurea var. burkii]